MTMDYLRIEYIEKLIEKRNEIFLGGNYNLLIHSVLNTIELCELIDFYLSLKSDTDIRKSIESNIYKRIANLNDCKTIFDQLLQQLDDSGYYERQRIRKILLLTLPTLSRTEKILFFNNFYYSRFIYDVESALSICDQIWDDSFNDFLIEGYLRSGNETYLKEFLKSGIVARSLPNIQKIWALSPSSYLKTQLIVKLSKDFIDDLSFLEETDPEKYLMAISYSDIDINDKTILKCLSRLDDEQKPFGLMSIGRMKKWELLKKEIKNYSR
jgi:hypothetical protein